MIRLVSPALAFLACLSSAASLESPATARPAVDPFSGTWVADLDSQSGLGKDVYLLAGGQYRCDSCTPPRSYPADGTLRPIGGPQPTSRSIAGRGSAKR
jgi:hypothetical protein